MTIRSVLTLLAGAAALMSSAVAQSIPAPASSVDSSARATVAINLANYATQTQVTNVQNTATAALSTAQTASGSALPWTRNFVGQSRTSCGSYGDGTIGSYSGCVTGYLDGNGQVYFVWPNYFGTPTVWQAAGYTSAAEPVTRGYAWVTAGITYGLSATVFPTAFDMNGRATNWAVRTNAW